MSAVIAVRVVGAMVLAAALRLALALLVPRDALIAEIHAVAAYLTVLGALYGIIVAFMLFVVWDQFNRVQTGLATEASAIEDVWRVAGFLSERDSAAKIRFAVRRYLAVTASDEPRRLARCESSVPAQQSFAVLTDAVRGIGIAGDKDAVVYGELVRALARVIVARDERLAVSATRIPHTLWTLVLFVSVALVGGFLVLGVHSLVLSMAVVAAAAGALTFLLSVIKDMDNPFAGTWNVSYAALTDVASRIA